MDKDSLIKKFINTDVKINKWDKKELDLLQSFLKNEIRIPHENLEFNDNDAVFKDWRNYITKENFFLGGWINIDFKIDKNSGGVWTVNKIGKPEPKLVKGTQIKKDDDVGAIELGERYMINHDIIFELLSNMKPKTKIKIYFQRFDKQNPKYNDDGLLIGQEHFCILESQSFDERLEAMKNKFELEFKEEKKSKEKLKEWKKSLFN